MDVCKQDLMGARAQSGTIEEGGASAHGAAEGASATAAKRMVQAVQQFVAMLQIQQVGWTCESNDVRCVLLVLASGMLPGRPVCATIEHPNTPES